MKYAATIWVILGMLFITMNCRAQSDNSNRTYSFHYICHDGGADGTNVQELSKYLNKAYDNTLEYENISIFYLVNGTEPIIVIADITEDMSKDIKDNISNEFYNIIEELQDKNFHNVHVETDINKIMELVEQHPFMGEDGQMLYLSVNFYFHVNKSFWDATYNEKIIAPLYWTFDMDKYTKEAEFYCNIFQSGDQIDYSDGKVVGIKNYCDMNNQIDIIHY